MTLAVLLTMVNLVVRWACILPESCGAHLMSKCCDECALRCAKHPLQCGQLQAASPRRRASSSCWCCTHRTCATQSAWSDVRLTYLHHYQVVGLTGCNRVCMIRRTYMLFIMIHCQLSGCSSWFIVSCHNDSFSAVRYSQAGTQNEDAQRTLLLKVQIMLCGGGPLAASNVSDIGNITYDRNGIDV